jgi:hypothetical protein
MKGLLLLFFALSIAVVAQGAGKKSPPSTAQTPETPPAEASSNVWIFRPDGARSCSPNSGQPLDAGKDELIKAGVHVQDGKKDRDGKMHAQFCGADTGGQNSFLIPRTELGMAEALGFKEKK